MNTYFNLSALGLTAMLCIASIAACSQKPSSEAVAAQVKIAMDQAERDKQTAAAQVVKPPKNSRMPADVPVKHKPVVHCANCGTVLAVNMIEVEGKGSGVGVVAGGVVGGLVGNQVGQGTGHDLATVAGVLGGAFAGNAIEKKSKTTKNYDIRVEMDNGSVRTFRQATDPDMTKGQKVRIENDIAVKS